MLNWLETHTYGTNGTGTLSRSVLLASGWPTVACEEAPESVVYTLNLPGFRRKDLSVEIQGRTVTVRGAQATGLLKLKSRELFSETLTLAKGLDEQSLRADFRDGVLSLTVAKQPSARARRISILVEGQPALQRTEGPPTEDASESWWKKLGRMVGRGS